MGDQRERGMMEDEVDSLIYRGREEEGVDYKEEEEIQLTPSSYSTLYSNTSFLAESALTWR